MRYLVTVCALASLVLAVGCKAKDNVNTEPVALEPALTANVDVSPLVSDPEPAIKPLTGTDSARSGAADDPAWTPGPGSVADLSSGGADERTYTVQRGDTLYALARKFYNDQAKWRTIYQANQGVLRDPNQVRVGQVLVIPTVE